FIRLALRSAVARRFDLAPEQERWSNSYSQILPKRTRPSKKPVPLRSTVAQLQRLGPVVDRQGLSPDWRAQRKFCFRRLPPICRAGINARSIKRDYSHGGFIRRCRDRRRSWWL